ncbi:MAG: tRNA pseudouridine(38-40) synthase TruA [Phycisphaerales bacterium]|nr:tRNA pseudouridine(38-40) synthase TruA [Phycisphaerales bacterium]MCB9837373.1 tRNA pseudouridine(38-40) synthase TruA [Phycisphaera sp.]
MPRYKLTIAYDGTDFCGWQKQEPPDPNDPTKRTTLRTVQGVVEETVREVLREQVVVMGASRTDSGVHALGQIAAFTSEPIADKGIGWPEDRGTDTLVKALNSKLPRDVLIMDAEVVAHDFNPIGGAAEKEYTYTIECGPVRPLWDRKYVFHTWYELDLARMQQAAAAMVGEKDFAAFAQIDHGRTTTVRTIFRCEVEDASPPHPSPLPRRGEGAGCRVPDAGCRFVIRVSGSGFLYNMVRIIAGTLMEVGRGKIEPGEIASIIESGDRRQAGPTLPPQGLRLEWVRYQ